MKLHELRSLIKIYDQTWYLRKYFYGDHERGKKFKQYLQKFENIEHNYEFTASDIFKLLKKIPELTDVNSNLQIIHSIRKNLDTNYLFEIYEVLKSAKLINSQNFSIIYDLSYEERLLLKSLFCSSQKIRLNSEILAAVLVIVSPPYFSHPAIEQSLRFLHDKDYFTPTSLNLLSNGSHEAPFILHLLKNLDKINCLNDSYVKYFVNKDSLDSISTLISLLNRAKITLNEELIKLIGTHSNTFYLIETISTLLDSKEFILTIETLTMLLKQDFKFFLHKNSVLTLLQKNNMLDNKAFQRITEKLPPILESSVIKNNNEKTNSLRSEFILESKNRFLIGLSDQYKCDSYSEIKKGNNPSDSDVVFEDILRLN